MIRILKSFLIVLLALLTGTLHIQPLNAQTDYFADGYHGGIYGHYPLWVTKFIADHIEQDTSWRLNLEIEPDTWDIVALKDPENYDRIKKLINDSSANSLAEYVNPAYAQSYFFNNSVESAIRHFQYGIQKLKYHFPLIRFTTYSSEEPCFTSALPQILKSFGFKYASLKNPNTCWGGYVRAHGGQSLNWVGPDGSYILTVPRYSSEALEKNSTWQTIAWNHSPSFINAAKQQGIQYPVGMCLQDAGWKNGPWLNHHKSAMTQYTTWQNYFKLVEQNNNIENYRLSQEDIQVSLVWGAQVLQRIAQQVRAAENKIIMAEKLAALASLNRQMIYPASAIDSAWKKVMLSQHHDCWIVPYNKLNNKTWAENVEIWCAEAIKIAEEIIKQSLKSTETKKYEKIITVYNPTSYYRNEIVSVQLTGEPPASFVLESNGEDVPFQLIKQAGHSFKIIFRSKIAPLGSNSYLIKPDKTKRIPLKGASIMISNNGNYIMETDLYRLVIDAGKGNINQLIAKKLNRKNFIPPDKNNFNTLRGYFYKDEVLAKSTDHKPEISIIENGPLQIKLQISNVVNGNPFSQTIQLQQGEEKIDMALGINYKKSTGIGDAYRQQGGYKPEDMQKAFYNDSSKLLLTFPLQLKNQKVYKDAPLDVTESKLANTFYNRWDEIKNNILLNWVDIADEDNSYGMALLSDHVTSYSKGENFPFSLTVQYAGVGLWGNNYSVNGPTQIKYALIPHKGNWLQAQLNRQTTVWNQPLIAETGNAFSNSSPFIKNLNAGIEVSAIYYKDNDLFLRLTNTGSNTSLHKIGLNCKASALSFVELNDSVTEQILLKPTERISFHCKIPLFGFKTIKLRDARL